MKVKGLIGFLICLLLLVGCSENKIQEGEVYDKAYKPSRTWVSYITTGYSMIPVTHHDSEKFKISIKRLDPDTNQWLTATYTVNYEQYEAIEIGDWIRIDY